MPELLSCPCCGSPSQECTGDSVLKMPTCTSLVSQHRVKCPICGLRTEWFDSASAAIAAWNQRARSRLAEMIAGGCGHRGSIHTNQCSDECGWFAFWDTDDDADYENRVNGCATEDEAIVALLEKTKAELAALRKRILWFVRMMYGIGVINGTQAGELVGLSLPDVLAKVESGEWPAQGEVADAETRALRALREAVIDYEKNMYSRRYSKPALTDVWQALAACDEAMKGCDEAAAAKEEQS